MGVNPKDLQKMMKQVQEMQQQVTAIQDQLAGQTFEGSAGGGVVKATLLGTGELVSVEIDPQVADPDDTEMLGDLVVAAVNQAWRSAQETAGERMGGLASGLGLPPGLLG
ncbi:MAG: YbaB/EbfC family nucleoid-associated protein [Acidimicrobiia bacterium]